MPKKQLKTLKTGKIRVSVDLTPAELDQLDKAAHREEMTRAAYMRWCFKVEGKG